MQFPVREIVTEWILSKTDKLRSDVRAFFKNVPSQLTITVVTLENASTDCCYRQFRPKPKQEILEQKATGSFDESPRRTSRTDQSVY
jgi:hypothetical protein